MALFAAMLLVACGGTAPVPASKAAIRYPMPRAEFYRRAEAIIPGWCSAGRRHTGMSRRVCERIARQRIDACRRSARVPVLVDDAGAFRRHAGPYMRCINPGVLCNGVLVRSRDGAARHCGRAQGTH